MFVPRAGPQLFHAPLLPLPAIRYYVFPIEKFLDGLRWHDDANAKMHGDVHRPHLSDFACEGRVLFQIEVTRYEAEEFRFLVPGGRRRLSQAQ
jgi:hypothetical protein